MASHEGYGSARHAPAAEKRHQIFMSPDPNPLKREGRFLCNVRFKNDLPEIPCDPKMLLPPVEASKLAAFSLTSLERERRQDMLFEPNLGISTTALDIERFSLPEGDLTPLDPADAALLQDEGEATAALAAGAAGAQRSRLRGDAAEVSWLLRTKYITNESGGDGGKRVAAAAAKVKAEVAEAEAEAAGSRAAQIAAIERSFEAACRPLVHPKNPALAAVEVLPILPDELLDGWNCVMAVFDGDPVSDVERLAALAPEERQRVAAAAQLKSFVRRKADGSVDRFVALMLPAGVPPPVAPGSEAAQGGAVLVAGADLQGDYQWVREYDSQVRYDDKGQTHLFRVAGDHVAYSDLNTRVALRKRKRGAAGAGGEEGAFLQPEKFVLVHPGAEVGEEAQAAEPRAAEPLAVAARADRQQPQQQRQNGGGAMELDGALAGGDLAAAGAAERAGAPSGQQGEDALGAGQGGGGGAASGAGAGTAALVRGVFGSDDDDE